MSDSLDHIFQVLEEIEKEFMKGIGEDKRNALVDKLLSLRKTMDQYIRYWLKFEDKLNYLQDKYGFVLPNYFPDDLFEEIVNFNENKEIDEKEKRCRKMESTVNKNIYPTEAAVKQEQLIRSFRRGMGFWDLAMLEEAVKEFQKVVKMEPDFLMGHFCLGMAYAQQKKYEEALTELRLVKALIDEPLIRALIFNSMGSLYAEQGKYKQALDQFYLAVEIDPEFPDSFFNIGAVHYNMKNYKEAVKAFEHALRQSPKDWEIYFYLGKACGYTGEFDKSLRYLKKASLLNPQEPAVYFELGVVYDLLGDKRRALFYYQNTKLMTGYGYN